MNTRRLTRSLLAGALAPALLLTAWTSRAEGVAAAPAAAPAATADAAPAAIPGKTGFVDMEKVFQGYYKTARSDGAFKKQKELYSQRAADAAAELEALKKQRDDAREKSLNIALSDDARAQARKDAEAKENLLREKDRELRDFVQSKDRELGRKYFELRNEIVKELTEYVRDYARKSQYETLLDVSGLTRNLIPTVVYYDKNKEITDALLAALNKGHENEAPKDVETGSKDGTAPLPPELKGGAAKPASPNLPEPVTPSSRLGN